MLSLSRFAGEKIIIRAGDEEIVVAFLGMRNGQGRIGIDASKSVTVNRQEVQEAIDRERGCAR